MANLVDLDWWKMICRILVIGYIKMPLCVGERVSQLSIVQNKLRDHCQMLANLAY